MTDWFFFWDDFLPTHSRQLHTCRAAACREEQSRNLLPRCWALCPGPMLTLIYISVRVVPSGQWVAQVQENSDKTLFFSDYETKMKAIFTITVHNIFFFFLKIERDFLLLLKTFISAFQAVFVFPFPSVSNYCFFSAFALHFCSLAQIRSLLLAENCKILPVLCQAENYAWAFLMSCTHLRMELIETNSQMMLLMISFPSGEALRRIIDILCNTVPKGLYLSREKN